MKSKFCMEFSVSQRGYVLQCDEDAPLDDVLAALAMMKNLVLDRLVESQKAQQEAAKAEEEASVEDVPVVEAVAE